MLVATRKAPPSNSLETSNSDSASNATDNRESLQPISQSSDFTPELASATEAENDDASTHFDDVLVHAAKTAKPIEPTALAKAEPNSLPVDDMVASTGSARRAASARNTTIAYEPVKFQGVLVGKSSRHDLVTAWGQPAETASSDEGDVLAFNKSPFESVEALVGTNDLVTSIKVTLATPLEADQLAKQLGLDRIDSVVVTDDSDTAVCRAYPERGVLFMFQPSTDTSRDEAESAANAEANKVVQVAVQPIDSRAFAYRAENRLRGPFAQNINDLKTAIAIDPEFGRAYWLLARVYLATGQADLADAAAAEACDIEPKNASFQLCRAQARQLLGEYDDAVLIVRAVLDRDDLTQIDRAKRSIKWVGWLRWAIAKSLPRPFPSKPEPSRSPTNWLPDTTFVNDAPPNNS